MIAGTGVMANPSDNYKFMILLSPAKSYYSGEVKVLQNISVEQLMVVLCCKSCRNYAAQFYPTNLANKQGFQQVIWTDDATSY
jgi:branched-chain amino acid aminotransferase